MFIFFFYSLISSRYEIIDWHIISTFVIRTKLQWCISFPWHEVPPIGKIEIGRTGNEKGRDEYVIHQIVHSRVCLYAFAFPTNNAPGNARCATAIKYLSTNPSRHAIRVTIRNSRFARGVTAYKYARTRSWTPDVCRYTYITRVLPQ